MRLLAVFAAVALTACPEPGQYGGPIPVVANTAWKLLPKFQPPPPPAQAHAARVHPMGERPLLGGAAATGKPGDLVLENDEVAFVISGAGQIVDAGDARVGVDELGQIEASLGAALGKPVDVVLTSGIDAKGGAWVKATGHAEGDLGVAVETTYALAAPDRALLVTTTVRNDAGADELRVTLGDAIAWGATEPFAPDRGLAFRGASRGEYVAGIGRATSYGITSPDGAIEATTDRSRTDSIQQREVPLARGKSVSYSRVIVVGARGDVASVVAELAHASNAPLGVLEIALVDEAGRAVVTPAGAKVVVAKPDGGALFSIRATREGDPLGGEVPVGKYALRYQLGGGRRPASDGPVVDIASGATKKATLTVTSAGALHAQCFELNRPGLPILSARRDATPCKITVEGVGAQPSPDFGPAYAAGPAKNRITTSAGDATVPIAPGSYRITMSRGPELTIAVKEVVVKADETTTVEGLLSRVVDTRGYVATDLAQHSLADLEAPVSARDRLIADAAEGLEVVSLSTRAGAADVTPLLKELGLEAFVAAPADVRMTGSVSEIARGKGSLLLPDVDAFLASLAAGRPSTPLGTRDARGIALEEAGYPRVYVRVDDDSSLAPWNAARSADVEKGIGARRDVVVTNGPMLRVTANGAGIGGMARGKSIDVRVHVECAPWVTVDALEIHRAKGRPIHRPIRLAPDPRSGAFVADATIPLRVDEDDALVVVVTGAAPLSPVLSGDAKDIMPWAVSGAIWIDADGDGRSLGRDR